MIQNAIFVFGTVVVFLLTLTIARAQKKLDLIIDFLKSDPTHPVAVIDIIAGPSGSKRRIIGYWLPWLCTFALLLASLASWFGAIQAAETRPQVSVTCSLAHEDPNSDRKRDDTDPIMLR